ncbi:SDR family NAD(P)-dependent oxidoreductase [Streptomyces sp. BI20]|uniref:SDR family NAD(P)-dependent oxidoreductase n=1 Tax=Streptomyces sp. BI20 TaxID=3403460 RepID=UPI003C7837E3
MDSHQGTRVVVTGAGGGIGAALAHRFAAEGATVVVNDLDAAKAEAVAGAITAALAARPGGPDPEARVLALPGDAADAAAGALDLLAGRVDVYCANAGIGAGGDAFAGDEVWEAAWETNVMAHVRAARTLLPHWLERGDGRFVATVSAAGLLSMIGAAPYSVTKHGALAHAEWLSLTYRHRGLRVHAVCPQGVRTDMLTASGTAGELVLAPTAITPEDVADAVFTGMAEDRFLILPHPEVAGYARARAEDPDRWLRGMNRVQRAWEERR